MNRLARYWSTDAGAGAAEFAIVLIPFTIAIFGIIHLGLMVYAEESLQFATEAAARCYAVDATNCGTAANFQTYAAARYKGPNIGATFVQGTTACGHTVTGTGTYQLDAVLVHRAVSLQAAACFP